VKWSMWPVISVVTTSSGPGLRDRRLGWRF